MWNSSVLSFLSDNIRITIPVLDIIVLQFALHYTAFIYGLLQLALMDPSNLHLHYKYLRKLIEFWIKTLYTYIQEWDEQNESIVTLPLSTNLLMQFTFHLIYTQLNLYTIYMHTISIYTVATGIKTTLPGRRWALHKPW